jgi:hypothetical protein
MLQNTSDRSFAIEGRTSRRSSYAVGPCIRQRIEQAFGWIKTVARKREDQLLDRDRVARAIDLLPSRPPAVL